jgi:hypothetical protein
LSADRGGVAREHDNNVVRVKPMPPWQHVHNRNARLLWLEQPGLGFAPSLTIF